MITLLTVMAVLYITYKWITRPSALARGQRVIESLMKQGRDIEHARNPQSMAACWARIERA